MHITQIVQPHILHVLIFKGNEKSQKKFTVGQYLTMDAMKQVSFK
jgi:hypothetical protein